MFENLAKRLTASMRRPAAFTLPNLVLEVQPGFVAGTRLAGSGRGPRPFERMAVSELESGAVQVLLNRGNISEQTVLHDAVRKVAEVVGNGSSRLGLLIPDGAARVGMLTFEALPDDYKEAEALVRWRMKDMVPYPPDEARISYQVLRREQASVELLAVAVKRGVLAEYESALEPIGSGPALILPATVALLPLIPEDGGAGQLLVHVCSGWVTVVVVAGNRVRLWRARQLRESGAGDLVEEVASEVSRVLAGSGDRLLVGIGKIWLCARPGSAELASELAQRVAREVSLLAPDDGLASDLSPPEQALFGQFGASVAGLIANAV